MSDTTQPPEGRLLAKALKRSPLSQRAAAKLAGISDTRWRQIVNGYEQRGEVRLPSHGPARTLARMALVVGVSNQELRDAGRDDAADEMETLAMTRIFTEAEYAEVVGTNPDGSYQYAERPDVARGYMDALRWGIACREAGAEEGDHVSFVEAATRLYRGIVPHADNSRSDFVTAADEFRDEADTPPGQSEEGDT